MNTPLPFKWDGQAMIPAWPRMASKQFVAGETYPLIVQEQRSAVSHNHYFACVHDAWLNLPEDMAVHFPTEEHLRKYALIKAGYTDHRSIGCASQEEAQRIAAFIKPMDTYAMVIMTDCVVTVYTAKSQSLKAMGKREFAASKEKVLEILSLMAGTTVAELTSNAGQAA
jgi:hypothetical protein